MKKALKIALAILLYIWQLPQNLLGLFFTWLYPADTKHRIGGSVVYVNKRFMSGISLGRYIILKYDQPIDIAHELRGHGKQSLFLGWLYLLVIGLPSLIHAWLHGGWCKVSSYYHFWTERWADSLAGIIRYNHFL